MPAKTVRHSTLMLTDTPLSRASPLPQLNRVHLQGIGWLSGRLRGQASLLRGSLLPFKGGLTADQFPPDAHDSTVGAGLLAKAASEATMFIDQ